MLYVILIILKEIKGNEINDEQEKVRSNIDKLNK